MSGKALVTAAQASSSYKNVEDTILELVKRYPEGCANELLERELSSIPVQARADALNRLLGKQKVQLFQYGNTIMYKETSVEESARFRGLNAEELMVYQVIKAAGNLGLWTKDMKIRTNLAQPQITKILKALETRRIVKTVKNVQNPSRKTYMLHELEPSREITGGAWYTEQQFDSEFIEVLRSACYQFIKQSGQATIREVSEHIRQRGVSRVALREEDIALIVNTLWFDGRLDQTPGVKSRRDEGGDHEGGGEEEEDIYKPAVGLIPATTALTSVPCGTCTISRDCHPGGVISPSTCVYMEKWLQF